MKRAVLIWLSVLVFGNEVSVLGAVGTIMVTCGVFLYQKAKNQQKLFKEKAKADKEHDIVWLGINHTDPREWLRVAGLNPILQEIKHSFLNSAWK